MNILYIGSGFVGACSAAVSSDSGHNTLVYDVDEKKIEMLSSGDRDVIESCIYEEGLGDLLIRNKERIEFTIDYSKVEKFLDSCDSIFMCLPTPEINTTGETDLSYYYQAAEKLASVLVKRNGGAQDKYVVIVNKSTVPVDMLDVTKDIMDKAGVKNYGVVSNPEFLVEGKAIEGSIRPDRVVIGALNEKDFEVMRNIYQRFYTSSTVKYIEVTPKEAEAGKLLANFYLFAKLAVCFDVIGRVCEAFDNIKFENVRQILTSEKRISNWGFYNSLYAGGSCLIKDARSLSHQLQSAGKEAGFVNEVYLANRRQLELFFSRAEKEADFEWEGKNVALLGLSFKQDTNDVRNSPSIDLVNFLNEKRVGRINIYDPVAMDNFRLEFKESSSIIYCRDESEAIQNADVIIIATDWPQFRNIGELAKKLDKRPLIMDGRRILQHIYTDLRDSGFSIIAVGSPFIKGK